MSELPVYVLAIIVLARNFGLLGVAIAWSLRTILDTAVLCWMCRRQFAEVTNQLDRSLIWLSAALASLAGMLTLHDLAARSFLTVVLLAAFSAVAWNGLLTASERRLITGFFRMARGRVERIT
jgi:hypothetical protein